MSIFLHFLYSVLLSFSFHIYSNLSSVHTFFLNHIKLFKFGLLMKEHQSDSQSLVNRMASKHFCTKASSFIVALYFCKFSSNFFLIIPFYDCLYHLLDINFVCAFPHVTFFFSSFTCIQLYRSSHVPFNFCKYTT